MIPAVVVSTFMSVHFPLLMVTSDLTPIPPVVVVHSQVLLQEVAIPANIKVAAQIANNFFMFLIFLVNKK